MRVTSKGLCTYLLTLKLINQIKMRETVIDTLRILVWHKKSLIGGDISKFPVLVSRDRAGRSRKLSISSEIRSFLRKRLRLLREAIKNEEFERSENSV
jgi:hypothetical protein